MFFFCFYYEKQFDQVGYLIFCYNWIYLASLSVAYRVWSCILCLIHHTFRLTQGQDICQASYMLFRREIVVLEKNIYIKSKVYLMFYSNLHYTKTINLMFKCNGFTEYCMFINKMLKNLI